MRVCSHKYSLIGHWFTHLVNVYIMNKIKNVTLKILVVLSHRALRKLQSVGHHFDGTVNIGISIDEFVTFNEHSASIQSWQCNRSSKMHTFWPQSKSKLKLKPLQIK